MTDGGNGWPEYKLWVEAKFIDHDQRLKKMEEKVDELRQAPGRLAIAFLAILLGAASSGVTTWLTRERVSPAAWTDEDRATIHAIRQLLERRMLDNDAKETHR